MKLKFIFLIIVSGCSLGNGNTMQNVSSIDKSNHGLDCNSHVLADRNFIPNEHCVESYPEPSVNQINPVNPNAILVSYNGFDYLIHIVNASSDIEIKTADIVLSQWDYNGASININTIVSGSHFCSTIISYSNDFADSFWRRTWHLMSIPKPCFPFITHENENKLFTDSAYDLLMEELGSKNNYAINKYCKMDDGSLIFYRNSKLSNKKSTHEWLVTGRREYNKDMQLIKEVDCFYTEDGEKSKQTTPLNSQRVYEYDSLNRLAKITLYSNIPNEYVEECSFDTEHLKPTTYEFLYEDILPAKYLDLHRAVTQFDQSSYTTKIHHRRHACISKRCRKNNDLECDCGFNKKLIYDPDGEFDYDDVKDRFPEYRIAKNYYLEEDDVYKSGEFLAMPSRNFWISPYETTQGEFAKIMGFNPSHHQACGTSCPVENVTWYQALAYANALSAQEGYQACYLLDGCTSDYQECNDVQFVGLDCNGYRLPTDEEWRFTARNFENNMSEEYLKKNAHLYDSDEGNNKYIFYDEGYRIRIKNSKTKEYETVSIGPHPVGELEPVNGLYDFYGNVYEWIWDWFGYAKRAGDSLGADRGYCRIIRGGCVYSPTTDFSDRQQLKNHGDCYLPNRGGSVLGFRLVRTVAGYHSYPELADYEYGEITDW